MDLDSKNTASRRLPKFKLLLNKYRQSRAMQSSLLRLSELAGTITSIESFYSALNDIITSLFVTGNFHIGLADDDDNLSIVYVNVDKRSHSFNKLKNRNSSGAGVSTLVFNDGLPLHCSCADRVALYQAGKIELYDSFCLDWLGVPLKRGKEIIGVIALQSFDDKKYFDDRDCELLAFIAEHIVTAIDRVNNRELLELKIQERTIKLTQANSLLQKEVVERKKAEKLHKALIAISEITTISTDLNSFYHAIHQEIKHLLPAENFHIIQFDPDDTLVYSHFSNEKSPDFSSSNVLNYLSKYTVKSAVPILLCQKKSFVLNESNEVISAKFNIEVQNFPSAWLSAPLVENDQVFGMLAIQENQVVNAYQVNDLPLIQFVAQHIATAIIRKRIQVQDQVNKDALKLMVAERTKELEISNHHLRMQIEERKKAEKKLFYDAHHDALTKLPNRAMLLSRLSYSLVHVKRHPDHRFAVLFIDLDRFKIINDTLGHQAGDEFLIEISQRLSECIRGNDLLVRLGGDEFVILLDSFNDQNDVEEVACRIVGKVSESFILKGQQLYSSASIGIAMFNHLYKGADEIICDADAAMYQAKSLGRGRYVFFDESMREQLLANMSLEQELRLAIKQQQFELYYQKITDLENLNTIGFEALLRWNHPYQGVLAPKHFLSVAEETGLILDIEIWVMEQVGQQLSYWKHGHEYENAFISVNLSGRYLAQENQLNHFISSLNQNVLDKHRLILEFNEKTFIQHTELALNSLNRLKSLGIKLALDDYGSGQSSFNLLHNYPFEFIKLDSCFIRSLNTNDGNIALIQALHNLGEKFGYQLVAEGIENLETLEKLKKAGCEFGQGYYINQPLKLTEKTNSIGQAELA
jgi:diguanylate cyclase (GGDEF)-like protein